MRGYVAFFGALVIAASVGALIRYERKAPKEATIPIPDRTYTPALFDTVKWVSEQAAIERGSEVFRMACAKCHGAGGAGDGGYVINGDTLHPPSFVQPGWRWRFTDSEQPLRQRIYLGNNRGMPHWGDQGIQPRDVVAVATYIQKGLRKDIK